MKALQVHNDLKHKCADCIGIGYDLHVPSESLSVGHGFASIHRAFLFSSHVSRTFSAGELTKPVIWMRVVSNHAYIGNEKTYA